MHRQKCLRIGLHPKCTEHLRMHPKCTMGTESASSWGASSASATSGSDRIVPPVPSESDDVVLLEESLLELSSAILAFFCLLTGGSTCFGATGYHGNCNRHICQPKARPHFAVPARGLS